MQEVPGIVKGAVQCGVQQMQDEGQHTWGGQSGSGLY